MNYPNNTIKQISTLKRCRRSAPFRWKVIWDHKVNKKANITPNHVFKKYLGKRICVIYSGIAQPQKFMVTDDMIVN